MCGVLCREDIGDERGESASVDAARLSLALPLRNSLVLREPEGGARVTLLPLRERTRDEVAFGDPRMLLSG